MSKIEMSMNVLYSNSRDSTEAGIKPTMSLQEPSAVTLIGDAQLSTVSMSCDEYKSDESGSAVLSKTDEIRDEKKLDNVIIPPESALNFGELNQSSDLRHGISRYAPYGTRFAAKMKDGSIKTSHVAGDLANRAKQKNSRNCRVDLVLVTHEGERFQLDSALEFFENSSKKAGPKPGPSEVLYHLKSLGCDWDYRKGDGVKLLQRNASNFFKRMMEHARRVDHPIAREAASENDSSAIKIKPKLKAKLKPEGEVKEAAKILHKLQLAGVSKKKRLTARHKYTEYNEFTDMEVGEISTHSSSEKSTSFFQIPDLQHTSRILESDAIKEPHEWVQTRFETNSFGAKLCKELAKGMREELDYYSRAAENFDYSTVGMEGSLKRSFSDYSENFDVEDFKPTYFKPKKKIKVNIPKKKMAPVTSAESVPPYVSQAVVASNPQPVMKQSSEGTGGARHIIKGLSRHSPYGTRFCAQMRNGEMRESFLAGDLSDRVRSVDGKTQSELILVLHAGEIAQLEAAWQYLLTQDSNVAGAGAVLEHLRRLDIDINYRKAGTRLLQKNAGNFFKRVQEYGKRKQMDPGYLSLSISHSS